MKKKKIAFFINNLDIGGSEKQLLFLIKELKNFFEIEIFCFDGGSLQNEFLKEKIKITFGQNKIFSYFQLIFFLFTNKSSLYHFILPKSYIICGILSFFSKKKKIMSRRSLNFYHRKYFGLSLLIEKILHKNMDAIVCNTNVIKEQLSEFEKVPKEKVYCIKNFYTPLLNSKNKKLIKKDKAVSFAFVANLIPYKGHSDLIEICSQLKSTTNWKLYLVGKGSKSFSKYLQLKVKNLGLENKIIFTGQILGLLNIYNNIDFVVNPSLEEGSSNFLLESISMALPILAYDIGGNKDFFYKNGYLVKYKDKKKFKDYLEKMINLKDKKAMKKNSLILFKKKINNKKTFSQYLNLYKKILDVH